MDILKYALLGIVQGLTEFLPVSSSGHLVLLEHWLKVDTSGLTLVVALHVATTVAVLIVYGGDIAAIFRERRWSYIGLILLCCAVTAMLFLPFKDSVEAFADRPDAPRYVGVMLVITGLWQFLADWRLRRDGAARSAPQPLTWWRAALLGVAQAVSGLLRGFSRSGATIGTAIQLGVERAEAARFSFLCSVPIVLGGAVLEAKDASDQLASGGLLPLPLAVGFICALLAGIVAIKLLLWMLRSARLSWFGAYCLVLGIVALAAG